MEIAVTGMAGRFPHAENIRQFWENLTEGRDCISRMEPLFYTHDGITEINAYGQLEDIYKFDKERFRIGVKEAESMAPQERLLLECVYEALKKANVFTRRYFYPLLTDFAPYVYAHDSCPVAADFASRVLTLPTYFGLSDGEVMAIAENVLEIVGRCRQCCQTCQ